MSIILELSGLGATYVIGFRDRSNSIEEATVNAAPTEQFANNFGGRAPMRLFSALRWTVLKGQHD